MRLSDEGSEKMMPGLRRKVFVHREQNTERNFQRDAEYIHMHTYVGEMP
jgi:hypothetical protein